MRSGTAAWLSLLLFGASFLFGQNSYAAEVQEMISAEDFGHSPCSILFDDEHREFPEPFGGEIGRRVTFTLSYTF